MRVRNRRKNPRCGCEHEMHFNRRYDPVLRQDVPVKRVAHRYQQGTADGGWAMYVGHVCRACEQTCMKDWMVKEHVCGEGDCPK